MTLNWKTGFEIELMAPPGMSRRDLAGRVAATRGGRVSRFFHPQSEPSKVKGAAMFENLTPGFEAFDADGKPLARFVDDVTLTAGLDRKARPLAGWYRIVSDEPRLIRLIVNTCDPDAPLDRVMQPLAALFGTVPEAHAGSMVRVSDDRGASVAIAAPLPGERERPCEIVTPPLDAGQHAALEFLLGEARALGFTLPHEGATHIHFDAAPLTSAAAIVNLVTALLAHGEALKRRVGTNPNCIRLGKWPDALIALVTAPGFAARDWPSAQKALTEVGLNKFCDFNLLNIATAPKAKHTFEVRVLPSSLSAEPILEAAELFTALLRWCITHPGEIRAVPPAFDDFLTALA